MVTALDQPADRLKGFEPGADDFLIKPVDDVALVKRVRKLARLKMLTDEMLMRASTEEQLGFAGGLHKPFDQVAQRLPDTPRREVTAPTGAFRTRSGACSSSPGKPILRVRCCDFPTAISISAS